MDAIKIEKENWDGILYPVEGRKDKVMLMFSGSDGGLEHAGKGARFLCGQGIPALAVALFKTKHTGKSLDRVPIERVGEAIEYLKGQGYEHIGIEGVSKGAEYAIAAAMEYPELGCVIIKTPSWFYSEGMIGRKPSGTSCWTRGGKELPYTPYKERRFNLLKNILKAKEFNILDINTGKAVTEESVIPVEKLRAPLLMFSTAADTIWPSKESCEKLCSRLEEKGFAYPYKHVAFEHMSHMMLENCGREIRWFMKSEKQYPAECAEERARMGRECVDWIENVWKV